jgi:hypothetical protein
LDAEYLKVVALKRFRELKIEQPTLERLDRLVKSTIFNYENQFPQDTFRKLSKETVSKMETLINDLATYDETEVDYTSNPDLMSFSEIRSNPGHIGLESVFRKIIKLKTIQLLRLQPNAGHPNLSQ